jgi:hypothetical protein
MLVTAGGSTAWMPSEIVPTGEDSVDMVLLMPLVPVELVDVSVVSAVAVDADSSECVSAIVLVAAEVTAAVVEVAAMIASWAAMVEFTESTRCWAEA